MRNNGKSGALALSILPHRRLLRSHLATFAMTVDHASDRITAIALLQRLTLLGLIPLATPVNYWFARRERRELASTARKEYFRNLTLTALRAEGVAVLPGLGRKTWSPFKLWGCDERTSRKCPLNGTVANVTTYANDKIDATLHDELFCDICTAPERIYFEAGGLNGVLASNTKMLEEVLNFRGMIVEGHPRNALALWANRGRSGRNIIINEAFCKTAGSVPFNGHHGQGTAGVVETMDPSYLKHFGGRMAARYTAPCRPLGEMLKPPGERAGHFDHIDVFSLDVEGAELTALGSMDWSIPVRLFVIETSMVSNPVREDAIRQILASNGYAPIAAPGYFGAQNEAFIHRDLLSDIDRRRRHCRSCEPLAGRSRKRDIDAGDAKSEVRAESSWMHVTVEMGRLRSRSSIPQREQAELVI